MNVTTTANYCEVHPGMDAKVRYWDGGDYYYDGCFWCWSDRPRAEKQEPIVEHEVPAYKRPNTCVDCAAPIRSSSVRCGLCQGAHAWVVRRERYGPHGAPR